MGVRNNLYCQFLLPSLHPQLIIATSQPHCRILSTVTRRVKFCFVYFIAFGKQRNGSFIIPLIIKLHPLAKRESDLLNACLFCEWAQMPIDKLKIRKNNLICLPAYLGLYAILSALLHDRKKKSMNLIFRFRFKPQLVYHIFGNDVCRCFQCRNNPLLGQFIPLLAGNNLPTAG